MDKLIDSKGQLITNNKLAKSNDPKMNGARGKDHKETVIQETDHGSTSGILLVYRLSVLLVFSLILYFSRHKYLS